MIFENVNSQRPNSNSPPRSRSTPSTNYHPTYENMRKPAPATGPRVIQKQKTPAEETRNAATDEFYRTQHYGSEAGRFWKTTML